MAALTPEALDTIEARANAATEGLWETAGSGEVAGVQTPAGSLTWDDHGGQVFTPQDANFIAHAREDIPALVVELRRLRIENEGATVANIAAWLDGYDFDGSDRGQEWHARDVARLIRDFYPRGALTGEATT